MSTDGSSHDGRHQVRCCLICETHISEFSNTRSGFLWAARRLRFLGVDGRRALMGVGPGISARNGQLVGGRKISFIRKNGGDIHVEIFSV